MDRSMMISRFLGAPLVAAALLLGGWNRSMAEEPRAAGHAAPPPRPAAPSRPAAAAPRPAFAPAGRPGFSPPAARFDGRGQVLDARYNHGRYYAPVGTSVRALPPDYRPYYHRGAPYYFSGGVWYAPRGPGFVVVTPPLGLSIAVLPPYYSMVWFGGVPYYYADNVYYTGSPDQSGYVVAPPPPGADDPPPDDDPNQPPPDQAPPPPPPSGGSDLIIYPKNGQSKDQQAADQYECNNWSKGQTGFDPTQPNGGVAGDPSRARGNYDRAMAACLTGRGYQVN
jgi:hypothetical protein